jgi:hypothetical protein
VTAVTLQTEYHMPAVHLVCIVQDRIRETQPRGVMVIRKSRCVAVQIMRLQLSVKCCGMFSNRYAPTVPLSLSLSPSTPVLHAPLFLIFSPLLRRPVVTVVHQECIFVASVFIFKKNDIDGS